jgi:hypothetical protein
MKKTYFDAKSELKKTYNQGVRAIKNKDARTINYCLSVLDQLEKDLTDKFELDTFGRHIITKEIKKMRSFLSQKLK